MTPDFDWGAYGRWENRAEAEADQDPMRHCRKFPDHDCEFCHASHVEDQEANPHCSKCKEETK